jgi:predicted nucleic acid-binding protein
VIVADASAVIDLLLAEDELRERLQAEVSAALSLEAPDLLTPEVLSAVVAIGRARKLSGSDVDAIVDAYLALPITSHLMYPYCARIAALSSRHSVYDAAYVALAEGLAAPLLTTDRRLARSVRGIDVVVV